MTRAMRAQSPQIQGLRQNRPGESGTERRRKHCWRQKGSEVTSMSRQRVRIEVSADQFAKLQQDVFCDLRLSKEQRRTQVKKVLLLPRDGSPVDIYCDG